MIAVLVFGAIFGRWIASVRAQRDGVRVIRDAGGVVYYDNQRKNPTRGMAVEDASPHDWQNWLAHKIGPDYLYNAIEVTNLGELEHTEFVGKLSVLPRLEVLTLSGSQLKSDDLKVLSYLHNIRDLAIVSRDFDGSGLKYLPNPGALRKLALYPHQNLGFKLNELSRFSSLTSLLINSACITDADLHAIAGLTNLESLSFFFTPIHTESLVHLRNMNLKTLNLRMTGVDDLRPIGHMTNLEVIEIHGPITDATLETLPAFPNLHILSVGSKRLTNAGLIHLANLPDLKLLNVAAPNDLSPGIAALQAKRLTLRIRTTRPLDDLP